MSTLEQRLENLERRNSQLQAVICLILILAVLAWFYEVSLRDALASQVAHQNEIPPIVKTRLLQVVDESGKVVWEAGASEQGGDMTIFNQKRQPVYRAEANSDGCTVQLNSPDGYVRALLASRAEDGGISILNDKAKPIVMLYGYKSAGNVMIQGKEESERVHLAPKQDEAGK
ncbi:hypothetical protein Pan241w_07720 [Gimesia alba]|uniref:Uncharacterized protein n=1 Tax=Gimesia alba TaxID=2527973 RepID=A0A517R9Z1_9PLAN|nr:hypothetical protein [Gimesia alba]QDT40714.1 hypothetical protein Pan241w_07720 [Gimesia alba]